MTEKRETSRRAPREESQWVKDEKTAVRTTYRYAEQRLGRKLTREERTTIRANVRFYMMAVAVTRFTDAIMQFVHALGANAGPIQEYIKNLTDEPDEKGKSDDTLDVHP